LLGLLCTIWFIDYKSNDGFSLCLYSIVTKNKCYGCGTLRGISAFLHADFKAVVSLNKLNIFSIPFLGFVFFYVWKNKRL